MCACAHLLCRCAFVLHDACVLGFISSRGTAGKDSKVILVDFTDGTSVSTANGESVFLFLLSGTGTAGIDGIRYSLRPRLMTGGNGTEHSRKKSRKFPGHFRNISGTFPE